MTDEDDLDECPITPEIWRKLPWHVKAWIMAQVYEASFLYDLAYLWLIIIGIDAQMVRNNA